MSTAFVVCDRLGDCPVSLLSLCRRDRWLGPVVVVTEPLRNAIGEAGCSSMNESAKIWRRNSPFLS